MAEEIAMLLLRGLVSGIASKVAGEIIGEIFGGGLPSYFTEVFDEIKKIMHQEITQNTIDQINGKMNGVVQWVENVYMVRKKAGASHSELFEMLKPEETDLAINMVAVLHEKAFAEAAIQVFEIAGSVNLAILQELAYVDTNAENPKRSSYVTSIKKYATDYANHYEATFNTIVDERLSLITDVEQHSHTSSAGQSFLTVWTDKFINKTFTDMTTYVNMFCYWTNGKPEDVWLRSFAAHSNYVAQVKEALTKSLKPDSVITSWRKLIDQPLPD